MRGDGRESVAAAEVGLAFDALCPWIYEDSLSISRSYHRKLSALADDLDVQHWMTRLDELVREDSPDVGLLSLFIESWALCETYTWSMPALRPGNACSALCTSPAGPAGSSLGSAASASYQRRRSSPEADTYDLPPANPRRRVGRRRGGPRRSASR
ncbi:MafI family immunity protein [Microbispora amethystogenes]|uniref:MafI family immunity protein n=1 Tax=Microbispora amethystogenes TaxID=1427754 RepID=UPI0033F5A610